VRFRSSHRTKSAATNAPIPLRPRESWKKKEKQSQPPTHMPQQVVVVVLPVLLRRNGLLLGRPSTAMTWMMTSLFGHRR